MNLEEKAKFFAQYWGCNVLYVGGVGFQRVGFGRWNLRHPDFFLELKPLSQISDEDLKAIGFGNIGDKKLQFVFDDYNTNWKSSCGNWGTLLLKDFDFLRSKGYALPWMGISVEEQIKRGWVKLK